MSPPRLRRAAGALALAVGAAVATSADARAQLAPDAEWRTFATEHFRVHFTPELEPLARRAAANAERAWAQLAAELPAPRGPVELVVADNVDFTNGYATTFPSNRIVVYAQPPVDAAALRFYDEWNTLVVTHELAHVFHLDRSSGWWRVAQRVFGRSPLLFPNQYLPSWVTEGIAVYYESRLTGSGRVAGTQHRAFARAAVLDDALPRPADWSRSTSRFPGGEVAYAYGGLFIDYLARTRGPEAVPGFVDAVADAPIPFLLERSARAGFGVSFERAWREWRDSLRLSGAERVPPRADSLVLADALWSAEGPRWLTDDRLVVGANTGREIPGAYTLDLGGEWRRVGRRNVASPNVPLADGGLLYAQPDFEDPYRIRSDLYVAHGRRERRLTHGARLFRPDARADGAIVAMQVQPGTTRLVRVSPDGATIAPLTSASLDEQWAEPRWSPDGARIAAVRWSIGGLTQVVVLDTLGTVQRVLAGGRAVFANPSWAPDGRSVLYSADSSGRPELYRIPADGTASPERLSATATALFHPQLAPDGRTLAAVRYDADGMELLAVPADAAAALAAGAGNGADAAPGAGQPVLPLLEPVTAPARPYSPWRTLRPTYWLPLLQSGVDGELQAGGATSGSDVIGRHAVTAQALVGLETGLREYDASWRYAGLGRPLLDVAYAQRWRRLRLPQSAGPGELRRRTRTASLAATWSRPRVRSSAYVSVGGEVQWRDYRTAPDSALALVSPFYRGRPTYPALQLSAGWSRTQRPLLSISPEDGVSLSATLRQRWLDDDVEPLTRSAVGVASAYRSLPWLPGFAHHVLALRAAGGWADDAATTEFEAGGVSGGTLEALPGIVLGEGARTFGVRGVPAGAQWGTRAAAGTLEWRVPLAVGGRGLPPLPLFFDRASLALFGDAGAAWCPASAAGRAVCQGARSEPTWLLAGGAELDLDIAVQYDTPVRLRLGVAVPRADADAGVQATPSFFVAVGRAF